MLLTSALEQYHKQQLINAGALKEARRKAPRGPLAVAGVIATYQLAAAALTFESTPSQLAEQGIKAPTAGTASLSSLLTGAASVQMLESAANDAAFDRLVVTLVQDAGRTASAVDLGRRPNLNAHVRSLNPPSCSRCAVLAGRVYRYSTGFQRHPSCDCLMTLSTQSEGKNLVTDVDDLIDKGQIRGLSKADLFALDNGADLGRVVNVRRSAAGLVNGSSVTARAGKLTPQGILNLASDKTDAVKMLRFHGYIR